jgi:hypothetical protein
MSHSGLSRSDHCAVRNRKVLNYIAIPDSLASQTAGMTPLDY